MAFSLLQKEEEYRKLNDELQSRNKKLMEEFDSVRKKQENLLRESLQNEPSKFDNVKLMQRSSLNANYSFSGTRNDNCFVPSKSKHFDMAIKENCENPQGEMDLGCVPSSVDQMGMKGMTHFYRAKIKAMQNEYSQLQQELKNKCEEIKKVQKESLKLAEEKDKWFQAYNTNKASVSKLENQITTLNSKCQSKDNENVTLRKEIEQLKKELKSVSLNVSGNEIRLNRALEDNEKTKSALKVAKQEEKDLREAHRKEVAELTAAAKRLEKQKIDLLTAFKKQLQLIDNLKKQKACLEVAKLSQISENEFMRILDWNINS